MKPTILDLPISKIKAPKLAPKAAPEPAPLPWFESEAEAKADLEALLDPWFILEAEVPCWFGGQWLRIDYMASPRGDVDFPYDSFGVEVKRGFREFRQYTAALKQAIDYTNCEVGDRRIGVVFVYPGTPREGGMTGGADRLAGQFKVGTIRRDIRRYAPFNEGGLPRFEICGGKLWTPLGASRVVPTRDRIAQADRRERPKINGLLRRL